MREVQLAELKDSWPAWLGIALTFVAVTYGLVFAALIMDTGLKATVSGSIPEVEAGILIGSGSFNLIMSALVGMFMISASTSLVIESRRGSLARLALVGATPKEVRSTVFTQLAAVTVVSGIVGTIAAVLSIGPYIIKENAERVEDYAGPPPEPSYSLIAILGGLLFAVAVALIGGSRQAKHASEIPPVEALRQASTAVSLDKVGVKRWVLVVLLWLVVASFFMVPFFMRGIIETAPEVARGNDLLTIALQSAVGCMVLSAAAMAAMTPIVIGPLTRLWTSLIPAVDPAWDIARKNTVARATRLSRTVVPITFAITMIFGVLTISDSFSATARARGAVELSNAEMWSIVGIIGLPLIIAIAGGLASLIMMSKQRDAELALAGVVGATPAQRVALPSYEVIIIVVNAAVLSLISMLIGMVLLQQTIAAAQEQLIISVPWATFFGLVVLFLLISVITTVLPTLRTLKESEPRVIARLIAE